MDLRAKQVEELAHAILATCRSPSARDGAEVNREGREVAVRFAGPGPLFHIYPWHGDFLDLLIDNLKSAVVARTCDIRARAMIEASGQAPGTPLPWMILASSITAAWLDWTGCRPQLLRSIRVEPEPSANGLLCGDVETSAEIDGYAMRLNGHVYKGQLSATIRLGDAPLTLYKDEPSPRLVIQAHPLPETLITAFSTSDTASNHGLRLSELVSHPFFEAHDPVVTGATNHDGDGILLLEAGRRTLAPVPASALAALPAGYEPEYPWAITQQEMAALKALRLDP